MTKISGQIDNFINQKTYKINEEDRRFGIAVQSSLSDALKTNVQYAWVGSIKRKTAVVGSDLDLLVTLKDPLTKPQRADLALRLHKRSDLAVAKTAVSSHAIHVERLKGRASIDISFSDATFGARQKTLDEMNTTPEARATVKLVKLWIYHHPNLPHVKGWTIEALVHALNKQSATFSTLQLFDKLLNWLIDGANSSSLESILRPINQSGEWRDAWSTSLAGKLIALQNDARRLKKRDLVTEPLTSERDISSWLWPST